MIRNHCLLASERARANSFIFILNSFLALICVSVFFFSRLHLFGTQRSMARAYKFHDWQNNIYVFRKCSFIVCLSLRLLTLPTLAYIVIWYIQLNCSCIFIIPFRLQSVSISEITSARDTREICESISAARLSAQRWNYVGCRCKLRWESRNVDRMVEGSCRCVRAISYFHWKCETKSRFD